VADSNFLKVRSSYRCVTSDVLSGTAQYAAHQIIMLRLVVMVDLDGSARTTTLIVRTGQ
jgi:hypothetical protein